MKTYNEIVTAIRDGQPITEEENKYALTLSHYLLMRLYFEGKRFVGSKTDKEGQKLTRLLNMVEDYGSRDLEKLIRGSSMEPGISQSERIKRSSESIAETALRLHNVLSGKKR